jgi:hypothetical protein
MGAADVAARTRWAATPAINSAIHIEPDGHGATLNNWVRPGRGPRTSLKLHISPGEFTMKTIAILATIMAVSAAAAAHAESKPQLHQPGSPIKQGHFCWVYTNATGAGWWDKCDNSPNPRAISLRGRPDAEVNAIENGGGGSGGGGGR